MTLVSGIRSGLQSGLRSGLNPGTEEPPADLDVIADVYVPSSDAQWVALGETAPDSGWMCSEGSGNLADYNAALTLTATTTPTYGQTTIYFTRPGVGLDDAAADRFIAGTGVGPDYTEAQLWLFYVSLRVEAAAARIIGGACRIASSTDNARLVLNPSAGVNRLSVNCDAVTINGTADHTVGGHVFAFKYDPDNSAVVGYSELEKVTGTFSAALVSGEKGIGGNANADMVCHAAWLWRGVKAHKSDAQVKTLLQTLGWTIPW